MTNTEHYLEWEAEKQAKWNEESNSLIGQLEIEVLSLQRQVAMLSSMLKDASEEYKKLPHSLGYTITHCKKWDNAITNTQATAEAYDRELTEPLRKRIAELEAGCQFTNKEEVRNFRKALFKLNPNSEELTKLIEEAKRQAVPEGWKLVPRVLNCSMREILTEMLTDCHTVDESYSDLLSAAPQPERKD